MPAGDLITIEGQAEIRALLLGPGSDYPWFGSLPDWWSKSPVLTADIERPRSDGVLPTLDRSGATPINSQVLISGIDNEDWLAKRDALAVAWMTGETVPIAFRWGDEIRLRNGRTRPMAVGADTIAKGKIAVATLQFVATDPLVYSAVAETAVTGVGTTVGGLSFPLSFPLAFGTATPGTLSAFNAGGAEAPWTATLTGPLVSPKILHVGKQQALELNSFNLPAGQTLEFDSAARTVLLDGTASRTGSLSRREWFTLSPGSNLIQLDAASGSGQLIFTWRSAWN